MKTLFEYFNIIIKNSILFQFSGNHAKNSLLVVAKETETGTLPKVNVNQSVYYKKSHLPQGLKMKNFGLPSVKWT